MLRIRSTLDTHPIEQKGQIDVAFLLIPKHESHFLK